MRYWRPGRKQRRRQQIIDARRDFAQKYVALRIAMSEQEAFDLDYVPTGGGYYVPAGVIKKNFRFKKS